MKVSLGLLKQLVSSKASPKLTLLDLQKLCYETLMLPLSIFALGIRMPLCEVTLGHFSTFFLYGTELLERETNLFPSQYNASISFNFCIGLISTMKRAILDYKSFDQILMKLYESKVLVVDPFTKCMFMTSHPYVRLASKRKQSLTLKL